MNINIENISEQEGYALFHALRSKFKWAGTVFCMEDVDWAYESEFGHRPTEEQLKSFMSSHEWTFGMRVTMTQAGLESLNQSVYEAFTGGK